MKPIIFALILLGAGMSSSAPAQPLASPHLKRDPRVVQLEMVLNQVNQEQQAVYQQFQMTQELRRNEIQDTHPLVVQGLPSMGGIKDAPLVDYDDKIRLQRERQERIQQYTRDLNRLYSRYAELGEQKKMLLDQLLEAAKE